MPDELPAEADIVWSIPLVNPGLGGIAANEQYVLFGDRDFDDLQDTWSCLSAATGDQLWTYEALAIGKLDYGNTPRATPLIHEDRVYVLGAFGHLTCLNLEDGTPVWSHNLRDDFGLKKELPWGYCGSPLIADGKLIVMAGGPQASVVALSPATGDVLWKTPGNPPSYGSLIAGQFGGVHQIVGHDATTLGGWDVKTGKRLWSLSPEFEGDFNVPTPIDVEGKLLITTEGNGTRLYQFRKDGTIDPQPVARNKRLSPDMSTPVVVGDRLFCVHQTLVGLDLENSLNQFWQVRDPALGDYAGMLASKTRLLIAGRGELLLVDVAAKQPEIVSRLRVFPGKPEIFSHPALVGNRLYLRGTNSLVCVLLDNQKH